MRSQTPQKANDIVTRTTQFTKWVSEAELWRLTRALYVAVLEDGNERCRQSSGFSTTCFTAIWGEPHSQKSVR
jgi:hypothetical protein